MKKLVKLLALALCAIMAFSMLAACGSGEKADDTAADTAEAVSVKDLDAVKAAGKLVVGMTDYAPMNYKDENGEWTGFDTEFAQAFGKLLGVDIVLSELDKFFLILCLDLSLFHKSVFFLLGYHFLK